MKKYIFFFFVLLTWNACTKEDRSSCLPDDDLVTPDVSVDIEADTSAFSGILQVLPCEPNSSIYYGNYSSSGSLSPFHGNYSLSNGTVTAAAPPVKLPVGAYNMLYWAVPIASSEDPIYNGMAINEPPLTLGSDLSSLYWELRPRSSSTDTT